VKGKTIAICAPGATFSSDWVGHLYELWCHAIAKGYGLGFFQAYCCYIHMTRMTLLKAVLECPEPIDYVLWIDHDNLVTWEQLEKLIAHLEAQPGPSIMAGWYYVMGPDHSLKTVVGKWEESLQGFRLVGASEIVPNGNGLMKADAVGFGCILMPFEVMKTLGPEAFVSQDGKYGEDFVFCDAAKKAGIPLFVDPTIEVPHLKLRAIVPAAAGAA
jgi:GT2 family glycosyltransferase